MTKPDPKADQFLAKAKRFRERAAGFRHTLARKDLVRSRREELETMVMNLEGAARQLEAMARGAPNDMAGSAAEEIRKLRAGKPIDPARAALIKNARNVRDARVASQVLSIAARGAAAATVAQAGKGPRKRGT
ncbi:MAG: hypothetical protein ACKOEE_06580 [Tagaea sp.]